MDENYAQRAINMNNNSSAFIPNMLHTKPGTSRQLTVEMEFRF
jgi:hypothetical protein